MNRCFNNWCLIGLAFLTQGCGPSTSPDLIPGKGVVRIDGKRATNVELTFMPDVLEGNTGPSSTAVSGPQGHFVVKTYDQKNGLIPGPHIVTAVDLNEDRPPQGEEQVRPSRLLSRHATQVGGLKVVIKEGETIQVDFKTNR